MKEWLQRKEREEFNSALGLIEKDHAGEIIVLGNIEHWEQQRNSSLSLTSALVNPITARALLQALQMTDSNDFQLPVIGRGANDFEIEESGFELTSFASGGKFDRFSSQTQSDSWDIEPEQ